MIVAEWPMRWTHDALRTLSTGYVDDDFWLCGKPNVCPTSCATTNSTRRPINVSGNGHRRARGSRCATWLKYQIRCSSMMLWYMYTSASRISPERGSLTLGPCAFAMSDGSHRTTE